MSASRRVGAHGVAEVDAAPYSTGMPNRSRKPKHRADLAQPAKAVDDSGETETTPPADAGKDPAAVALGRKGGLIGGKVRAANMTKRQRTDAAKRAATARWG